MEEDNAKFNVLLKWKVILNSVVTIATSYGKIWFVYKLQHN
jgi:hypothetical protein